MPEGDTIWRTARVLDAALAGHAVIGFASSVPRVAALAEELELAGRRVERVEARGKHLLVHFSNGLCLHTHMGMHGGWLLRQPGRAGRGGRVRIDTDVASAVCQRAPVVELLSARELREHPALRRLGPDVLAPGFDSTLARERLRAHGELEIGVALLRQSLLAGIGNVYKSELLFLCRIAPETPVSELDDAQLDNLVGQARRLLQANLGPGPRRTSRSLAAPLHVYGRAGQPCLRCGTTIRRIVQGEAARSTYLCPGCQRSARPR